MALIPVVSGAETPSPAPLAPPPQDKGLPYTRSAQPAALDKIKDGVAVFAGSRYGYAKGYRVRLSDTDLLQAEAVLKDGKVYVPGSFAAVLGLKEIKPAAVPAELAAIADRWVYAPEELAPGSPAKLDFHPPAGLPSLDMRGSTYYSLTDLAQKKGMKVTLHPSGLLYIGDKELMFGPQETAVLESVITLFDTPEKYADPDIATKTIPTLKRQGKWTDHVKATPAQLALLNGPETKWETAKKADYDLKGFNKKLLGSKVPAPGVYPRLLFSEADLPMLAEHVKKNVLAQMSMIEMDVLFKKTWWDSKTSDGQIFEKLSSGHLEGLEWADCASGTAPSGIPQQFKGQKPGIYNSHVAYVPECLTAMALYCLITKDDAHGRQAAAAIANYYRLREPLVDEWNALSDSEFGSSYTRPDGTHCQMDGNGGATHWRGMHGVVAHMNLGLSLDFAGKWMTSPEKELLRRVIAKATYGKRAYGQDATVRFRDVNWVGWDLPHFLALTVIEGLEGFDREAYASNVATVRAFCDWGVDDAGVIYESNGKTPGSLEFITLSMVTLARRGENLWGHPHWRKLLEGQIQMTSPSGRVVVNSGTQYAPFSRQPLSYGMVDEFKAFFPKERTADYLLSQTKTNAELGNESWRAWSVEGFDAAAYREMIEKDKRLRLPSPTYPGFVRNLIYDTDYVPTTRADLNLPLDFNAPTHGVFSAYSDRTADAVWMNLLVRPDHYLGAGHHHSDAGMFHFSGLGVDWFTESNLAQVYDGKVHNQVLVDGCAEPENMPGVANGYQAAAKFLGVQLQEGGAMASADLTDSYSYRWLTQPPQVWSGSAQTLGWEMDPSLSIQKIYAGMARYKMRPWWSSYTYCNFLPTSRAPFNPMRYVFRTVGLVRGKHPYGLVVDDLKKDEQPHLYQWTAMLNGGVWQAEVAGLPANQVVLACRSPEAKANGPQAALAPAKGEPLLLVCALGLTASGDALPLMQVSSEPGPADRNGKPQSYNRLAISVRAPEIRFRVALIPFRMGEPLPQVDGASMIWDGQKDELAFSVGSDARTRVSVKRGKEAVFVLK